VLNVTFNNTSVISWWSVLLVDETGVPGEKHILSQVTDQLYHIMLYLAKEKGQTMIYLTPHREQYIDQREPHLKLEVNSDSLEV
jgi:hypothetical protein